MKKTHADLKAEIKKALDTPHGRKIAAEFDARIAVQEQSLRDQGFSEKEVAWWALSIVMNDLDVAGEELIVIKRIDTY